MNHSTGRTAKTGTRAASGLLAGVFAAVAFALVGGVSGARANESACSDERDVTISGAGALVLVSPSRDNYVGFGSTGVGADLNGSPTNANEAAVCVKTGTTGSGIYYVEESDKKTGSPGTTYRVRQCPVTPGASDPANCTYPVGSTGAEVNQTSPQRSCVWVDGVERTRNTGC